MALHLRFEVWYLSLPLSANLQREMTKSQVLRKTKLHKGECFILFLSFNTVLPNSVPGIVLIVGGTIQCNTIRTIHT